MKTRLAEVPGTVRLVVDGFETVDEAVAEDLERLLVELPSLQVVLLSRIDTALRRLAGDRWLDTAVVGEDALAFDQQETTELAQAMRSPLAPAAVVVLVRETRGWPAPLRAAIQELQGMPRIAGRGREEAEMATDMVWRRVVAPFERRTRLNRLLALALADAVTPDVADALQVSAEDVQLLQEVQDAGFGWWDVASSGGRRGTGTFVFGQGFQQALLWLARTRGYDRLFDEPVYALTARFGESGEHEKAFRVAARGRRWKLASRHLRRSSLFVEGTMPDEVAEMIERVPPADRSKGALMLLTHGLARRSAGDNLAASQAFIRAAALSAANPAPDVTGEDDVDHAWTRAVHLIAMRQLEAWNNVPRAVARLREAVEALAATGDDVEVVRTLAVQLGLTYVLLLDMDEAVAVLERYGAPAAPDDVTLRRDGYRLGLLALAYAARGELEKVDALSSASAAALHAGGVPPESPARVPGLLAAAMVAVQSGAYGVAERALGEAWGIPAGREWALLHLTRSTLVRLTEGAVPALAVLDEAFGTVGGAHRHAPAVEDAVLIARAEVLLAKGRLLNAQEAYERVGRPERPAAAALRAKILTSLGDASEAVIVATRAIVSASPAPIERASLLLVKSVAHLARGDEQKAVRDFAYAVRLTERHGLRTPFAGIPHEDDRRLRELLAARDGSAPAPVEVPHARSWQGGISLTRRERIVLTKLVDTGNAKLIADTLFVSQNTVKSQLRTLYRKLGVHNREDALREAQLRGFL